VVEPCRSFAVTPNRQTRRLEVVRRPRKCLHYYLYLIDPAFGWMHVRLQTWAPYEIQVYVNGREWLARQMDRASLGYRRSDNKITQVDDFGAVSALGERFAHTDWPPVLERQAALVNPLLPDIERAGFPGYWWVIDQCEYASDVLFTDRAALEMIRGDLVTAAVTALGAADVGVRGASEQKMHFGFDALSPPEISDLQRFPHPTGIVGRYALPLGEARSAVLHAL
jgi:ribosome-binding ATPase